LKLNSNYNRSFSFSLILTPIYLGELGLHDNVSDVRTYLQPEIFQRLIRPLQYDSSRPVQASDVILVEANDVNSSPEIRSLMRTPYATTRQKLVKHFDYRFNNGVGEHCIKWPSRTGSMQT
jgi:hypothetical protein